MDPATSPPRVDAILRGASRAIDAGEAALLLCHVMARPHGWLYAHGDATLEPPELARFDAFVARRAAGEPLAYLTGTRGFWTLDLQVSPDTLIPRADTERLVELALERLPAEAPCRIADLGTGSGAIALSLARERPRASVVATDRSHAALSLARRNAERLGIANVTFREGDWFAPLAGLRFDLVASNPPYLAEDDPHLGRGDLRFEPRSALASGADGLDAIRAIAAAAGGHLRPGGWLLLEHGNGQGAEVRRILGLAGLLDVATTQDIEGRDRVSLGRSAAGTGRGPAGSG